jgi:hypothetical protein
MESAETWIRPGHGKVIALLHGIGAHDPQDYWQAFLAVLSSDPALQDFGIFVWKYPTHVGSGRWNDLVSTVAKKTLRETAPRIKRLGAVWDSTYRTQFREYQDVFLICHSMGGLVVKSWIIDLLEGGQSERLKALRHIAFYATPHNGAPVTTLADWNKQLKDMQLDSPFIEDLGNRWHEHVVAWKDRVPGPEDRRYNRYIPQQVIAGLADRVVPSPSATIRGISLTTVPGDHSEVIQPLNVADTRYQVWRTALDAFVSVKASSKQPSEKMGRDENLPDSSTATPSSSPGEVFPYASVFISYSTDDEDFAQRLHTDLQNRGVNCWFAPHDLKIGDKLRTQTYEAIQKKDKLLLVLSEHAVKSDWVEREVELAFERERQPPATLVLFPIRLDDAVMQTPAPWAGDIRRIRFIGDFRQWQDETAYQQSLQRLLRDLYA